MGLMALCRPFGGRADHNGLHANPGTQVPGDHHESKGRRNGRAVEGSAAEDLMKQDYCMAQTAKTFSVSSQGGMKHFEVYAPTLCGSGCNAP
jgi:hypothetical protein